MAAGSARWHNALKLALQREEGKKNGELLAALQETLNINIQTSPSARNYRRRKRYPIRSVPCPQGPHHQSILSFSAPTPHNHRHPYSESHSDQVQP